MLIQPGLVKRTLAVMVNHDSVVMIGVVSDDLEDEAGVSGGGGDGEHECENDAVMRPTLRVAVDSLVAFFLRAARSYPPPYLK